MPNVPVSISTLLFCQSRFPMVNKTNSGRTLSSLYEASACNQSLHLPAHRSLPPSPTSSNPFILLIYLPIYQSAHTDPIDPSFLLVSNFLHTHTHTLQSLSLPPVFPIFFCLYLCEFSELLLYLEHHPASYSSGSTVTPGSCPVAPPLSPPEQWRIKSGAEGHLESGACCQRDKLCSFIYLPAFSPSPAEGFEQTIFH